MYFYAFSLKKCRKESKHKNIKQLDFKNKRIMKIGYFGDRREVLIHFFTDACADSPWLDPRRNQNEMVITSYKLTSVTFLGVGPLSREMCLLKRGPFRTQSLLFLPTNVAGVPFSACFLEKLMTSHMTSAERHLQMLRRSKAVWFTHIAIMMRVHETEHICVLAYARYNL